MAVHECGVYRRHGTTRLALPDDAARAFGLAIAAFGPLLVAGHPRARSATTSPAANVVLVFVLVVVLGAAVGTRWSGALAAVVAAMSFDFFFTRPYQSLKIDNADDIETTVLLLVDRPGRRGDRHLLAPAPARVASTRGDEIARLHRVAELVASATPDAEDVVLSVQAELIELLSLRDCRYETAPFGSELPRSSATARSPATTAAGSAASTRCPRRAPRSRCSAAAATFGRLVLVPDLVGRRVDRGAHRRGRARRPARRRVRGRRVPAA